MMNDPKADQFRYKYRWIWRLLPALVVMIIIFVHSALPADVSSKESSFLEQIAAKLFSLDSDTASFVVRKCAHFLEYLVLGICMMFFGATWKLPDRAGTRLWFLKRGLPVWGCGTAYAVSDEIHQMFVPGRSCEFQDVCIDAAGVLAGVGIYLLVRKIRSRSEKR